MPLRLDRERERTNVWWKGQSKAELSTTDTWIAHSFVCLCSLCVFTRAWDKWFDKCDCAIYVSHLLIDVSNISIVSFNPQIRFSFLFLCFQIWYGCGYFVSSGCWMVSNYLQIFQFYSQWQNARLVCIIECTTNSEPCLGMTAAMTAPSHELSQCVQNTHTNRHAERMTDQTFVVIYIWVLSILKTCDSSQSLPVKEEEKKHIGHWTTTNEWTTKTTVTTTRKKKKPNGIKSKT